MDALKSTQEEKEKLWTNTALSSSLFSLRRTGLLRERWRNCKAISESSDVRPEARGCSLVLFYVCVSLQAHTVPATAH